MCLTSLFAYILYISPWGVSFSKFGVTATSETRFKGSVSLFSVDEDNMKLFVALVCVFVVAAVGNGEYSKPTLLL